jgi:hypothetical protein
VARGAGEFADTERSDRMSPQGAERLGGRVQCLARAGVACAADNITRRDHYVIGPLSGTQIWLVAGFTDMRKAFAGLSALVQTQLEQDPYAGALYIFRGKSGARAKSATN